MVTTKRSDLVFVDSNFFCALYNPNDTLHLKANSVADKLSKLSARICISNYIFLEVVTIVSQRVSKAKGVATGEKLANPKYITSIHVDDKLLSGTWSIYKNLKNKDVSFVDVSIITTMLSENIKVLVTFDSKLAKLAESYKLKVLS